MSSAVCRAIRPTWSRVFSRVAEASMPMTRRRTPVSSSRAANPAIIPAWVEPVTVQTTIVSKKTPEGLLLLGDLEGPVGESEPAEPVLGGAGRDRVGRAAAGLDLAQGVLPRVADADVEAMRVQARVGAHHPREQDVADLVVHRVVPGDPLLLHEAALQAEVGRDRRDLAGVVGLVAADRDEGVGAGGEASGTMYSSLRTLLPPKARPLLTSSRLAQIWAPPRCAVSRRSGCTGLGPKVSGWRGTRAAS
jgi:hypothetical protein